MPDVPPAFERQVQAGEIRKATRMAGNRILQRALWIAATLPAFADTEPGGAAA